MGFATIQRMAEARASYTSFTDRPRNRTWVLLGARKSSPSAIAPAKTVTAIGSGMKEGFLFLTILSAFYSPDYILTTYIQYIKTNNFNLPTKCISGYKSVSLPT